MTKNTKKGSWSSVEETDTEWGAKLKLKRYRRETSEYEPKNNKGVNFEKIIFSWIVYVSYKASLNMFNYPAQDEWAVKWK